MVIIAESTKNTKVSFNSILFKLWAEKINKKIEITWAAVDIYQEKKVSIPDLVNKTNISATEI